MGAPQGALAMLKQYFAYGLDRYRRLHFVGKIFIWCLLAFYVAIAVFVIVVTPGRIAQVAYDLAKKLAETRLGWLAIAAVIVLVSFPPLIGHTSLATLCGFAYGLKGFAVIAVASVVGSAIVFVTLRLAFGKRLQRWSADNTKWQALETVVRAKGLPLIILIRVSPFPPWVYSNALFASISSVALWQFVIATLFIFPKLLLHVFIGSRMAALSDGDTRGRMDGQTKALNGALIGGGIVIAVLASWLVYTLVQRHIRKLEGLDPETDELAAEAIEEYVDEEAPLLRSISPPPRRNREESAIEL